jgi:hypothetical protein
MSSRAKKLGTAGEKGVVERAEAHGLKARRQPLSGILKEYPHDIHIEAPLGDVLGESKVRSLEVNARGAKTWTILFEWLTETVEAAEKAGYHHAALFVRPKGSQRRYVLIEEAVYLDLLARTATR